MAFPELVSTQELVEEIGGNMTASHLRVIIAREQGPKADRKVGNVNLYNKATFMKWWKSRKPE